MRERKKNVRKNSQNFYESKMRGFGEYFKGILTELFERAKNISEDGVIFYGYLKFKDFFWTFPCFRKIFLRTFSTLGNFLGHNPVFGKFLVGIFFSD